MHAHMHPYDACHAPLGQLKSELNFPIGAKTDLEPLPQRFELPMFLLDGILFAQRGQVAVSTLPTAGRSSRGGGLTSHSAPAASSTAWLQQPAAILRQLQRVVEAGIDSYAIQRNPHLVLLSTQWYRAELRPVVAQWAVLWLLKQDAVMADAGAQNSVEAVLEAVKTPTASLAPASLEWIATLQPATVQLLNLTRDWVCTFVPHCLGKINRVAYGLLQRCHGDLLTRATVPESRKVLAVPFVGKDVPSATSEFAHPEVRIGLTILAYRYEGLRVTDLSLIITQLKRSLLQEHGALVERKSRQLYDRWLELATDLAFVAADTVHGPAPSGRPALVRVSSGRSTRSLTVADAAQDVLPLELLQVEDRAQMTLLHRLIRRLPDVVFHYMRAIVFPRVLHHQRRKLTACGQDLGGNMVFGTRLGFRYDGRRSVLVLVLVRLTHLHVVQQWHAF